MITSMNDLLTTGEVARCLWRSAENVRYLTKTGKAEMQTDGDRPTHLLSEGRRGVHREWSERVRGRHRRLHAMSDSHGKPLDSASTPSPWMNVAGAASYARMSPSTIRRAIRLRRLAAYRLNGGSGPPAAARRHRLVDSLDSRNGEKCLTSTSINAWWSAGCRRSNRRRLSGCGRVGWHAGS